jgi:hypothetical protein
VTPAYCRSVDALNSERRGETTCSSNGLTSDATVAGKLPLQSGPGASVPVQTSVPLRGMVVEPVGAPPVTIVLAPLIAEAGRVAA